MGHVHNRLVGVLGCVPDLHGSYRGVALTMLSLMENWRLWNIKWWGKILEEAEREGPGHRVVYAKWMLETLLASGGD